MSGAVLELEGDLRAGDAEALRARLLAALAEGDVVLRTAGLTAADTAVVQVLLSAQRTARQLDRNLQIDAPQAGALGAMAARLALGDVLAA